MMRHPPMPLVMLLAVPLWGAAWGCALPLGDGESGELRVGWTFKGAATCAEAEVATVAVQVVSKDAAGGAETACEAGSVLLSDLVPGKYDVFLDGAGTTLVWSGTEKIEVLAGQTSDEGLVALSAEPGPAGASLSLVWTFASASSCAQQGVDAVDVVVVQDDAPVAQKTFPCTDGGARLSGLPVGPVQLQLAARDGDVTVFAGTAEATLSPFATDLGVVDLAAVRGRLDVAWTFAGDARCEAAGVGDVSVQLIDDAGTTVAGSQVDCLVGHVVLPALPLQHVTVVVEGLTQGARIWANSVAVTVAAGDNPTLVVDLEPTFARARIHWRFADAGNSADCAALNVANVTVQVVDANAVAVAGGAFACAAGTGVISGLPAGTYRFVADAFSSGGALVAQDQSGDPRGVTQALVLGDNDVDVVLE